MFDFANRKLSPIGLDISRHSVRMIQLEAKNGQIIVVAADEIVFDADVERDGFNLNDARISSIKSILGRGEFVGRKVVSCLSDSQLKINSVRLDVSGDDDIEKMAQTEVVRRFGLDPESDEIRYVVAGNIHLGEEIKNELILFSIDGEQLRGHIGLLESAGVVPVGVDAVPFALFRSSVRTMRRQADEKKVSVLVDVAGNSTTVIMGRAQKIIFAKQIPIGSEKINQEIASKLGIDINEAAMLRNKLRDNSTADNIEPTIRQTVIDSMHTVIDELARETSLCFRYYAVTFRGERPEQVMFAGSEVYEQTLISALKRHLAVDIELVRPLRDFGMADIDFPGDKRGPLSEWAVAVGLCMKNFKPMNEGSRGYERN